MGAGRGCCATHVPKRASEARRPGTRYARLVPNSPKAWGYEAYCYFLDKDPKAGLSAWYTARSFDPAITLDSQKEQDILLIKVRQASAPPPAAK